jgi:hypothetical protein
MGKGDGWPLAPLVPNLMLVYPLISVDFRPPTGGTHKRGVLKAKPITMRTGPAIDITKEAIPKPECRKTGKETPSLFFLTRFSA